MSVTRWYDVLTTKESPMKRFMTDLAADPLMAALLLCFIVELSFVALNSFL